MNPWPDEVFERILTRVAQGERVRAICAEPGQPNQRYIFEHRKANPDFARRWAAALGRRSGSRIDPALFEQVLRRVIRGENVVDVCREPGMPCYDAVLKHRRRNRSFAARWDDAVGRKARIPDHEIEAVLTRLQRGERLTKVCREPGMPGLRTIHKLRQKSPELDKRFGDAMGARRGALVERNPSRLEDYLAAAREGRGSFHLNRLLGHKTLQRLRTMDPSFAARVDEARQAGRAIMASATTARKLSPDEVWRVVESAVRNVPEYARDDIRGDLMMALLEGRVSADQAGSAVRGLVTAWNRQFSRRDISMDAELGDGDGLTFGGLVATADSLAPAGVSVIRGGSLC